MSEGASNGDSQFLVFVLNDERFAIAVRRIREVLEFTEVTRIPGMPDHMRGVVNLRGVVVPVIDMCLKLGFGETKMTVETCIVICEVELAGTPLLIGALVDAVEEVINLDGREMFPPPHLGSHGDCSLIRGLGRHDGDFVIVLDLAHAVGTGGLPVAEMASAAEAASA